MTRRLERLIASLERDVRPLHDNLLLVALKSLVAIEAANGPDAIAASLALRHIDQIASRST